MIQHSQDVAQILQSLSTDPIGNIYPISLLQGYPQQDIFYQAFTCDTGVLVHTGGTAYLSGDFNQEELNPFLQMLHTQEIITPTPNGNKHILVYRGKKNPSTAQYATNSHMPEIWQLLVDNFHTIPDYNDFLQAKTNQRLYLGGQTGVITVDGTVVSTASILVQSDRYALLGAVATHPDHRKHGHAANILRLLINHLLDNNKTPIILCDNPVAIHLYQGMGFEEYGKMMVQPYVF